MRISSILVSRCLHMSRYLFLFTSTLLVSGLLLTQSAAIAATSVGADAAKPNAGMRYASINVQTDNAHNRQTAATLSLTLGDYFWLQGGGGKDKAESTTTTNMGSSSDAIDSTLVTGGLGLSTTHWQYTVDFTSHSDGDNYTQRDWTGSLAWHNNLLGIGIDGMRRTTET